MTVANFQSPESNRPGWGRARNLRAGAIKNADDESAEQQYADRQTESIPSRWLNVREAAEYASISVGHACTLMTSGKLRSVKLGKMRRTRTDWVDGYLCSGGRA